MLRAAAAGLELDPDWSPLKSPTFSSLPRPDAPFARGLRQNPHSAPGN